MEPKFNTSFIPKKSLQDVGGGTGGRYVGRRDVYGPGFFLSLFLFLIAIVATVGLFAYSKITEDSIDEKIGILEGKKGLFNSAEIRDLIRADAQLKNATKVVNEHVVVSELFTLLEKITLKRVQYTGLVYEGFPTETALVSISGLAKNFQDVALQTEQYRLDNNLRSPIVKELERLDAEGEEGDVNFTVDVLAQVDLLSFSAMLKRGVQGTSQTSNIQVNDGSTQQVAGQGAVVDVSGNAIHVEGQGTTVTTGSDGVYVNDGQGTVVDLNNTGANVNTY